MRLLKLSAVTIILIVTSSSALWAEDTAKQLYAKANVYSWNGFYRRAAKYYRRAIELDNTDPRYHNGYAWLLATSPDSEVRNGALAVTHARQAYLSADKSDKPWFADTVAAAYAQKGAFAFAVSYQQQAVAAFQENDAWKSELNDAERRLASYQNEKAWLDFSTPAMEPVLIPQSLFKERRAQVEQFLANEYITSKSVLTGIFLWNGTGNLPPQSFYATPKDTLAPLEYIVVSDQDYRYLPRGESYIIATAGTKHRSLIKKLNAAQNILPETRYAFLAEMSLGLSPAQITQIETECRQDEPRTSQQYIARAWRTIDADVAEYTRRMFRVTGL